MRVVGLLLIVFLVQTAFAQRNLVPGKKRSEVFGGSQDFKEYRPFGLQISAGPTFMLTRRHNPTYTLNGIGRTIEYTNDPEGLPGIFVEAGMIHLPMKRSKLSEALKFIFVSYIDWGVGFKVLGGAEKTHIEVKDPAGNILTQQDLRGQFYNGFAYARGTVHKNFYIKHKYFIDNGLGINIDYNVMRADENSSYTTDLASVLGTNIHSFHKPLVAQIHYNLGFGVRLNRRSMFIVSGETPILGLHEWRKGCAALKWYNSNYLPVLVRFKWTYLFEKKVKGCAPARVNDQDKNTMQNK